MTTKKSRGKILTTAARMREAAHDAREREKTATKIRAARYDGASDTIVTELSTGASLIVPRRSIPGLARATPRALSDLAVNPGGESLWSETADDGVLLEQLLEISAGEDLLKALGGRISGRRRSAAKARASRANGAKGGRPPLSMDRFVAYLDEHLRALTTDVPPATRSGHHSTDADRDDGGATWSAGDGTTLFVKAHGPKDVHVAASWPRKRSVERRIRATADRLARELASRLTERRATEAAVRLAETRAIANRAHRTANAAARKRRAAGPR